MSKRLQVLLASIAMTSVLTGAMSLLLHRTIRADFMVTGLVCAVVISLVINSIVGRYRRALRDANQELERRVEERTEQLMANERLAAAGTLAAGVSHEVRNPLTAIVFNLECAKDLLERQADLDELEEIIEAALEGTAQVQVIARDLATLANPSDDELGPIDIGAVLASASRLSAHHVRRAATLDIETPDGAPMVIGSVPRLLQVFLNLFINAAQAADKSDMVIRVTTEVEEDAVRVTVADDGPGIPEELMARVFDPFFTTKGDRGGTGLGLSICRGIVEGCGGTLSLESTVGVGTSIGIVLRRAPTLAREQVA